MATTTETLLTAEEFLLLPDADGPTELVKGHVVRMNPPNLRHGQVCNRVGRILGNFVEQHNLGHVLSNDSAVVTTRGPDSVRGADVAFYSYAKLPAGPLPQAYATVPPDLVIEVLSPSERRAETLAKVAEYLAAGVRVVCVFDSHNGSVQVHYPDQPLELLSGDQELTLPGVLQNFSTPVADFFK